MLSRLTVLAAALLLSACAIGNEYNYNAASPALEAEGTNSVTVAVSDQRSYILSGAKMPDFVGLQRGGYGNPFDVTTTGDEPFANQLATAIARTLSGRGYKAAPAFITPGTQAEQVPFQTDRLLYIAMREWKSDVAFNITMHHDADATVYKPGHSEPVTTTVKFVGPGGAANISPSASGTIAVAASERKIAELLNYPEIRAALN